MDSVTFTLFAAPDGDQPMTAQDLMSMFLPALFPPGFVFNGVPGGDNFHDILDRLMREQQPGGPPPTSTAVVDQIPRKVVVPEDVIEEFECAVCKDDFVVDQVVMELPCHHQFHQECALPWLKEHNTCPVCRYELPTDDLEFEEKRKERMRSRNVDEEKQLRHEDDACVKCEWSKVTKRPCVLLEEPNFESLRCGHNFHPECLCSWLRVNGTIAPEERYESGRTMACPVCQSETSSQHTLDVD